MSVDTLFIVLGDQLDYASPLLSKVTSRDAFWMAENTNEATYVPSHASRLVFFFAAMRHYRNWLDSKGLRVFYHQLSADPKEDWGATFSEILRRSVSELLPKRISVVEPGDFRVQQELQTLANELLIPLEIVQDTSFYCSKSEFQAWSAGKKNLLLEFFYREMRKRHHVLMADAKTPEGGQWNFDKENRSSFGRSGPPRFSQTKRFSPDEITSEVVAMVRKRFAESPGSLDDFSLPVTRAAALELLEDFLQHRFAFFGLYQDAMWNGADPFLFHSRLSAAINVKLLRPQEVISRAIAVAEESRAPFAALEGFVRQILGWREYVRGVYWQEMPEYQEYNAFGATHRVPKVFWDGQTEMACLADAMQSVLHHAYAHHIQRLMVLGQYALLYGVDPYAFHQWHMGMYADAIDWVSMPNVLGMSQYADGGLLASKPYCASGNYINKMSNYCKSCRFSPAKATGDDACPFTTLYWDFLRRNRVSLELNQRMVFQMKNLERKSKAELSEIAAAADRHRGVID
jgi:deoxyribodipyrimidine photolyase-related protein